MRSSVTNKTLGDLHDAAVIFMNRCPTDSVRTPEELINDMGKLRACLERAAQIHGCIAFINFRAGQYEVQIAGDRRSSRAFGDCIEPTWLVAMTTWLLDKEAQQVTAGEKTDGR